MASHELELRSAAVDEGEFAFHVWKAAMEPYIALTWGWNESLQRQRQQEEFAASAYQIIEVAGQSVGTCVTQHRPECLYLSGLYILPEHQGQGIGSQVLKVLSALSELCGLPIQLRVLRVNPAAQRLYERNGFAGVDDTETDFIVMEKAPQTA